MVGEHGNRCQPKKGPVPSVRSDLFYQNRCNSLCKGESNCLNLKRCVKKKVSSLLISAAPFRKKPVSSSGKSGCQIDLLLQTRKTVYVVEVKRQVDIDRGIIKEVDKKLKCLKRRDGTSMRAALVYDGNLARIVDADGYFNAIIPFKRLLGMA